MTTTPPRRFIARLARVRNDVVTVVTVVTTLEGAATVEHLVCVLFSALPLWHDWDVVVGGQRWWGRASPLAGPRTFTQRICETAALVVEDGQPRMVVEDALAREAVTAAGYEYTRGHSGLEDFAHPFGDCYVAAWHPHDSARRACGDPRCGAVAVVRAGRRTTC
jgi:hypothetical protein